MGEVWESKRQGYCGIEGEMIEGWCHPREV